MEKSTANEAKTMNNDLQSGSHVDLQAGSYVDLHTHTRYSDGLDHPGTIVMNAAALGLDAIAITDHDSMDGFGEAQVIAEKWRIKLVPGVEITTPKYHILGLNVDPTDGFFRRFLEKSKGYQRDRADAYCQELANAGMPISIEKVAHYFPKSRLGKLNIVFTMMIDEECRQYVGKRHAVVDVETLMGYLRKGGVAAKIPKMRSVHSAEAINAIHAAGGVAILAHPYKDLPRNALASYADHGGKNAGQRIPELERLVGFGLDGLEVQPCSGMGNIPDSVGTVRYAEDHGLFITYGSDFHGARHHQRPLLGRGFHGNALDEVPIPNRMDLALLGKHGGRGTSLLEAYGCARRDASGEYVWK